MRRACKGSVGSNPTLSAKYWPGTLSLGSKLAQWPRDVSTRRGVQRSGDECSRHIREKTSDDAEHLALRQPVPDQTGPAIIFWRHDDTAGDPIAGGDGILARTRRIKVMPYPAVPAIGFVHAEAGQVGIRR